MKALTIHQPWAWAIAAGIKCVENRTWSTRYRGPLAIHAGRQYDHEGAAYLAHFVEVPDDLTRGAIIAVARLIDVRRYPDARQGSMFEDPLRLDPMAFGPFCWLLGDVRRLSKPRPCRGYQGLFTAPRVNGWYKGG